MNPTDQGIDRAPLAETREPEEPDLLSLLLTLWRGRLFILVLTVLCALLALAYSFLLPPVFTAKVTMLPHSQSERRDLLGRLASIAGGGLTSGGSSELLYSEIVTSDRVLDSVLSRQWTYRELDEPASFYEIFKVPRGGGDEARRQRDEHIVKGKLRRAISFSRDRASGYMALSVSLPRDPALAASLANFLVDRLSDYNRNFHHSKAAEQRAFIEGRLQEVEGELKAAEEALTRFVNNNRSYTSSPNLMQRYGELKREAEAQTSIWVELRRQLELAKIDENSETVSIDVLNRATAPLVRSSPNRRLICFLGLFIGVVASVSILLLRDQVRALTERVQSRS